MLKCPYCGSPPDRWFFCEVNKVVDSRPVFLVGDQAVIGRLPLIEDQHYINTLNRYMLCRNCNLTFSASWDHKSMVIENIYADLLTRAIDLVTGELADELA